MPLPPAGACRHPLLTISTVRSWHGLHVRLLLLLLGARAALRILHQSLLHEASQVGQLPLHVLHANAMQIFGPETRERTRRENLIRLNGEAFIQK
jgi:hypothetical protein